MVEEDEARARGEGMVNKNHRKEEHFTIARNLVRHQRLGRSKPAGTLRCTRELLTAEMVACVRMRVK